MQEHVRKTDTLARLGGDEFALLMKCCNLGPAHQVANSLRTAIADFQFVWQDKSFRLGVSIGLALITESSRDIAHALSMADSACYAAKSKGRNRICVFCEDDEEIARQHGDVMWVSRIDEAVESDLFRLYYQPIVPVEPRDGDERHYELLLRMRSDGNNVIPPSAFLPAAERYNRATKIDHWVVDAAFRWLAKNLKHLDRKSLFAINLSGCSIGDEEFSRFLTERLTSGQVPPENICFELTETAAIANLTSANQLINTLTHLGCRFALDDFGSGLSSFAYLKNLKVDYLKIDGVFVKDILNDPVDLAIVKSINEIGCEMGKLTIAEFVENDAIRKKLGEIGVHYAQGYGIGRPRPIEELIDLQPDEKKHARAPSEGKAVSRKVSAGAFQ